MYLINILSILYREDTTRIKFICEHYNYNIELILECLDKMLDNKIKSTDNEITL